MMEGKKDTAVSQSFPCRYRLGSNRNYRYVYRKGKSYPSRNLVLIYLKGKEQRIGFSVSSKVGNAVVRNRIRRIFREDVRKMRGGMKNGKYIFVARAPIAKALHPEITRELHALLTRADLFKKEN